jgi:ferritin-like metal-binding protein YciE
MKSSNGKSARSGSARKEDENSHGQEAQGLRDLFVDGLKDIYWAEKALTRAIPKMIKKATEEELANALTDHLEVTQGHVTRLEEVFESIGEKAVAKKCEAMAGLIKEAEEIMTETEDGVVRDAGIIMAGQKVEHYEIATYGTLASFAKTLGEDDAASLLEETLQEEKEADEKLSEIAGEINVEASHEEA